MTGSASRFLDALALRAIRFYGRHLSPRKGFCCARAAVHGGESCSAAVARIIRDDGLIAGRRRVAERFAECRQAHDALRGGSP
ncbi:membrane protein insertion efficiency factor YidD [Deinococcus malanensis]